MFNQFAACSERFGVEASENGTYRAANYNTDNRVTRLADERESFGDAFMRAQRMAAGEA